MATASLTKVGNSMAVLLPKALRQKAAIDDCCTVSVDSPRKGVVVITAIHDDTEDRLARLDNAEARIAARSKRHPWPEGATADDLLKASKDARADEFDAL